MKGKHVQRRQWRQAYDRLKGTHRKLLRSAREVLRMAEHGGTEEGFMSAIEELRKLARYEP